MRPYATGDGWTLYLGDCREVLPELGEFDCCVTDPPYGETSLPWDRWPDGWPTFVAAHTSSLWCFGSLRMLLTHADDFGVAGWRLSQDLVWEKHHGSGFAADRFKRVHELATHWYQGPWNVIHHEAPREKTEQRTRENSGRAKPTHTGDIKSATWTDDGTRLMRSVLRVPTMWRRGAIHPTEKPVGILTPLITYACPPGGLVLDPFAGSGSTLEATRAAGREAVGIEADEAMCAKAAARLSQTALEVSP